MNEWISGGKIQVSEKLLSQKTFLSFENDLFFVDAGPKVMSEGQNTI